MSRGEISPCSTSTRSSSETFDSPRSSTPTRLDLLNNVGAISSVRSDGTLKTRTIAIAVKAHEKMRPEPFGYALNHLVEQKNCKVVVICCLSRLQSELGVDHIIDVETFGGISKKKLEAAINNQINNLNHFLRSFREQLDRRGVQLDIRISAGPKSDDILVHAAKALHPHWVVLDGSFSGHQRSIQERLECNLVLVKKNSKPLILQLTTKYLGPIEQLEDEVDPYLECPTPNVRSSVGTPATVTTKTSLKVTDTTNNATSNTNSKVFTFCMCFNSKVAEEGPTKETTVLYGNTTSGSQAAYLGKVGNQRMEQEVAALSSRIPSPSSSPATWFSSTGSRKANTKSVKIIEQELEARMAKQPEEDDYQEYKVQL
ncbi:unnamed protein product [Calypogeia fissa]